jgi:molybdate transport system substrate-binding protein
VDYVGPLPPEVQQVTFFSAGIGAGAKEPEVARELIRFFTSPVADPVISKHGLKPARDR